MQNKNEEQIWNEYTKHELEILTPILERLGFELEEIQPHITGERFLMHAVTTKSGKKLILLGKRMRDGKRVVIKATRDRGGTFELLHERKSRDILQKINFAYQAFLSPCELLFTKNCGYTILIHEFVKQESSFLERPMEEQFTLALKAFKAQEGAHLTTYEHKRLIKKTFQIFNAKDYIQNFDAFKTVLHKLVPNEDVNAMLENSAQFLNANKETIDQYSGFLTHTDFVPHNFRVKDGKIYLLDHSSIRFGNKYEGWARFLNFMALYNPELEKYLTCYIHNNRTREESLALKLMRVYRLGELMYYYANSLSKTTGDLNTLNQERIRFWGQVMKSVLADSYVSKNIIDKYKKTRDSLRSEEEKKRQIGLH